ncbi:MAG: type IV pili twitching motility protein PilT [Deltaproteobacteria bacterium RIFOXYA12_FULL_61_11]|nr:MAG: type IV pili twitching motility protein PilT [Deltaproteobacteria bacterium RIFOXYA12_FULL_61_11]
MAKIDSLFRFMVEQKASDMHLSSGAPPKLRVSGSVVSLEIKELSNEECRFLLYEIMPDRIREQFEATGDVDFAYSINGLARFRANVFQQHRGVAAVFRRIPEKILSVQDLDLPKAILQFTDLTKGLVVVTGATGSGKSTTLAALIDHINSTREDHLITLEDPIEFVHQNKRCLVNQREVHRHTQSFAAALRAALREDPDIILVGEMRDLETIELALTAAETGHLVFGTLHTNSAPKTIERIINVFPHGQQEQIRMLLSEGLKGVIAQNLLRRTGGGRVAALEVMVGTPAVNNLIRENKVFMIKSSIQTGKSLGMQTMDQSLLDLVQRRLVAVEEAMRFAEDKSIFRVERPGPKGAK